MKNLYKLLLSLPLLFVIINSTAAKEVPINEAKRAAKNFYFETTHTYSTPVAYNDIIPDESFQKTTDGEVVYYIINFKPDGFVFISAEDTYNPILGYSLEGSYHKEKTNQVFESWMSTYVEQIDYLRNNNLKASREVNKKWERYLNASRNTLIKKKKDEDIRPLLTSKWNQNYPYNVLCPEDEDGPGGHAYAGCVATAMSMIMHYYKYPSHGFGQKSYSMYPYGTLSADFESTYYMWNAMTDDISEYSTEHSISGIAELQYHCGVSTKMDYAIDGSGTYNHLVPEAIKDHFGYSDDAVKLDKNDYLDSTWREMIKENLEDKHPIYYSGCTDDGCHAFILDGMQGSDMFHFNFGWGGYLNGYFHLTGEGAVGKYNQSQAMIKNFYPDKNKYPLDFLQDTVPFHSGTLNNPGNPGTSYPTGSDISWLLTPSSTRDSVVSFELEFLDFDLEGGADFVRIYDGATTDADLIGEFTGTSIPPVTESSSDSVLIRFITDENKTAHTGFRITYKAIQPEFCDYIEYIESMGSFDDGSGDKQYRNNSFCQFQILPPEAENILLTFNEFNLADGDILEIYEKDPTTLLTELTGSEIPAPIKSSTGKMVLVLQSDNMNRGQGFDVSYQIDATGISGQKGFENLTLFPNPAVQKINIRLGTSKINDLIATISSIDGKQVFQEKINFKGNLLNKTIDVSGLEKGVYLFSFKSQKAIETRRVVIQ